MDMRFYNKKDVGKEDANLFGKSSFEEIHDICINGTVRENFKEGDTKVFKIGNLVSQKEIFDGSGEIVVESKIDEQDVEITIIGIDEDGKGLTCMVSKYMDVAPKRQMNPATIEKQYGTNFGGWKHTVLRKWLNKNYFEALPKELRTIITPCRVTSSPVFNSKKVEYVEDKLWLLSERELFWASCYGNKYAGLEEKQYPYFEALTSKGEEFLVYEGDCPCWFWSRSSCTMYVDSFCAVSDYGFDDTYNASYILGVFPIFHIG
jgi:hypothetical protein